MTPDMTKPTAIPQATEKVSLRRQALAQRALAHGKYAEQSSAAVRAHGMNLISAILGGEISGYLPIRDELSPMPLMQALADMGRGMALPVIDTKWAPLTFRAWRPGHELRAADFGLKEPMPAASQVFPDILLVPVAAFDNSGHRIGYGGGYYDRTLALYRSQRVITAIGIAYDCQEVPAFAHEPHDERLDHLITPTGVRTFGS